MNKKILFTPVGGTDPMSETNDHDGPIIHIARHYKPDIICMYMSKEILEKQKQDDRYRYCIRKLGERLEHTFEIEEIERPQLEQVQLFDPIYTDFETILDDIISKLDDTDELLLNISSGTPAMKSALLVLATMVDIPCKCIQVDTPQKGMNEHKHDKIEGFLPEVRWEVNWDNTYKPGDENYDRTHVETLVSLKRLKYEESIKKFVASYDYHAALLLAESMNAEHTKRYIDKLKLADARQKLNFYDVDALIKNENKEIYGPVRTQKNRKAFEYMLALQAKVEKGEYADFLRGISPIFIDLLEDILLKQAHFHTSDYTVEIHGIMQWDMVKLNGSTEKFGDVLNNAYQGMFSGGWVKSDHLIKLIEALIPGNQKLIACLKDLRKVEETVRNTAAHKMVALSDQKIQNITGWTCKEIIALIKEAFSYTSYNIKSDYWNSYDVMNADIIHSI